jgi:hypothetical protein
MKLVAMLNWYEESPQWLAALVATLPKVGIEHIVCVDGAYQLFPDALTRPRSGPEQVSAIVESAHVLDIGVTVHRPKRAWRGNEIEKRNHLVQLALQETEPEDWLLQLDADEQIAFAPPDLHRRLEEAEEDVAGVYFFQRNTKLLEPDNSVPKFNPLTMTEGFYGHRILFRAQRDLHIEGAHYGYVANGTYLRGKEHDPSPALDLPDLKVEHRHNFRMPSRNIAACEYYEARALHQIEELLPLGQYASLLGDDGLEPIGTETAWGKDEGVESLLGRVDAP